MNKKSRYDTARRLLIFQTLFIGIGAVAGAATMIADPSGKMMKMDEMLPYFQVLPFADVLFRDLRFSGFALLIVNGLTNIIAAVFLIKKKHIGVILGGLFGITLMLWICIQFYMFPANFMSTVYFIFGFLQSAVAFAASVFERQEAFSTDTSKYKNVGTDNKQLVVYFSRMGYVKKIAYEAADKTGAEIHEIKSTELTNGTAGFWWCGRFGMHKWDMPIEKSELDLKKYDRVTICSPIWVFNLAAPVRSFCRESKGQIGNVDYILVHHTKGRYENAADEMDKLLGITRTELHSIQNRVGQFKEIK